jgi:hypothetical protein
VRITLESTAKVVELIDHGNRVSARVWEGHTDDGVGVIALIARITPAEDGANLEGFERDLLTTRPPVAALTVPHRLLL